MTCQRCGACCRVLIVPFNDSDMLREFLDARDLKYAMDHGRVDVEISHVCPHLLDNNDCDLPTEKKPITCKDFPGPGQRCLREE